MVYNKQWQPSIYEQYLLEGHSGSYGYSRTCVDGAQVTTIEPKACDLWLFNTRNFHEIMGSSGPRITVSSFIGEMVQNKYALWS